MLSFRKFRLTAGHALVASFYNMPSPTACLYTKCNNSVI